MSSDYSEVNWGALRPILQDMADRLARIEQFLAASGLQVPQSSPSASLPFGSGDVFDAVPSSFTPGPTDSMGRVAAAAHGIDVGATQSDGSQIPEFIVRLATTGKKIQAIKELRSFSGMDLKQAKTVVDQIERRGY